ncbi:MAG: peptidylprolyl isomerase [Mycoplasmatales bacterium]
MDRTIAVIEFEDLGLIKLELFMDIQNSSLNFIHLANTHFYDDLTMHRIIPNFVAQGGCPEGTGTEGPGYSIPGEFSSNDYTNKYPHDKGVISWARSQNYDSAGSQFFLTLGDAHFLDDDYAVFGKIIEDNNKILDKLNKLGTDSGEPLDTVLIKTVYIEGDKDYPLPEMIVEE